MSVQMKGLVRVQRIEKDRSVSADTGFLENVVTFSGIETMLFQFAGGADRVNVAGLFSSGASAQYVGLGGGGVQGNGHETMTPSYDVDELGTELTQADHAGYARLRLGASPTAKAEVDIELNDRSIASSLTYRATFVAGFITDLTPLAHIDEVGLFDDVTGAGALKAGRWFTPITLTSEQEVQVTYIILLSQAHVDAV